MSTENLSQVDYVVINTGYTSRILRANLPKIFLDRLSNYCDDEDTKKIVDENGKEPPATTKEVLDFMKCIYVKDALGA
jgi:hypothetical protein